MNFYRRLQLLVHKTSTETTKIIDQAGAINNDSNRNTETKLYPLNKNLHGSKDSTI